MVNSARNRTKNTPQLPFADSVQGMSLASVKDLPVVLGALTGGLLSSSCCVLQLVLNCMSIGCAGFSAITPYQSYFKLLTGGLLSYLVRKQGLNRRTATTVLCSCMLMMSQDIVSIYNKGTMQHLLHRSGLLGKQQQEQQQEPATAKFILKVHGLRCEACAARLRGALHAVSGVQNCTVNLEGGEVEVWGIPSSITGSQLVKHITDIDPGYTAQIVGHVCYGSQQTLTPCAMPVGQYDEL